jgi:hypothetical protein
MINSLPVNWEAYPTRRLERWLEPGGLIPDSPLYPLVEAELDKRDQPNAWA